MASRLQKAGVITAAGALIVSVIAGHEGLRTTAYHDVANIPTICFGETRGVHMGDKATRDECNQMLVDRLVKDFEPEMRSCLKTPDALPDKTYAASLSLTYNIGSSAFCRSTVATKFNAGKYEEACDAFLAWNKARVNGMMQVVKGLDRRRHEERDLCLEGLKK